MLAHQASHGFAAEIHKRPRPSQQQFLTSHLRDAYSSLALSSVKVDRMKPGVVIEALEANIVAVMGIVLAGVSQTNDKFH